MFAKDVANSKCIFIQPSVRASSGKDHMSFKTPSLFIRCRCPVSFSHVIDK